MGGSLKGNKQGLTARAWYQMRRDREALDRFGDKKAIAQYEKDRAEMQRLAKKWGVLFDTPRHPQS